MSNPIIYRSALGRSLTADQRKLVESCLARSERIEALARSLPEMILANRGRREGREVTPTKSQSRTIRSFERDSRKAEAELPRLLATLPSVDLLLDAALEGERSAMRMDGAVYTGGHAEDAALAGPLFDLRSANIAEIEAFLSRAEPR